MLENGALNTVMPRSAAAARSIWLVPMQNAPTASSCGAAASTRSVTWVLERTPSRCTLASASTSSSSSSARSSETTSKSADCSSSAASGWICSSSRTRRGLACTGNLTDERTCGGTFASGAARTVASLVARVVRPASGCPGRTFRSSGSASGRPNSLTLDRLRDTGRDEACVRLRRAARAD